MKNTIENFITFCDQMIISNESSLNSLSLSDIKVIFTHVPNKTYYDNDGNTFNDPEHDELQIYERNNYCGSCNLNLKDQEIDELYIEEKFRRRGFASILLATAVNKYNCNKISVLKDNLDAQRLYKSLGFKKYAEDDILIYLKINKLISINYKFSIIDK